MTWVKLSDDFPEHPKMLEVGPLAAWLFVRGLAYSNRHLTDGLLSIAAVRSMGAASSVKALVKVGLWKPVSGGYEIHDYLDYQPSRADVLDKRQKRQDAGRLGGLAKAQHRASRMPGTLLAGDQGEATSMSEATGNTRTPVPRPEPDRATSSFHSEHGGGPRQISTAVGRVVAQLRPEE